MRIRLTIGRDEITFDVPDGQVAGAWAGPPGIPDGELFAHARAAFEAPLDFPPLRLSVVEGDRVAIPFDPDVPVAVLDALTEELNRAGIATGDITVITPGPVAAGLRDSASPLKWHAHDPDDADGLSYLASTAEGRRVYLSRELVDADVVFPVGRIGPGPGGPRGPWGAIFPALSDRATLSDAAARQGQEAIEVSWLLGCQLHIGVVPGDSGTHRVLAGAPEALHRFAEEEDSLWTYRADRKADLVVATAGGESGGAGGLADLGDALITASRLVAPGGRIALLTEARGELGPAFRQLMRAGREGTDPLRSLKGLEAEADYPAARALARARSVATVYLLSGLEADDVEDLSMVALDGAGQAGKLVEQCRSCHFVNRINWIGVRMGEERA